MSNYKNLKVIKKHSLASIVTSLLSLFIALIPVLFFIYPVISFSVEPNPIMGVEFFQSFIFPINKHVLGETVYTLYQDLSNLGSKASSVISIIFPMFFPILITIVFIIYAFAFREFINSIILLFAGKVNNWKKSYSLAWGETIFLAIASLLIFLFKWLLENAAYHAGYELKVNDGLYYIYIYTLMSLILMILLGIIYVTCFKGRVYIGDKSIKESSISNENQKQNDVNLVNSNNDIPQNIKSIGNHCFSCNKDIKVATIPNGIKIIGSSAFANCVNLEELTIPNSIESIEYNAFFNCAKLKLIKYSGTSIEWRKIKRGSNWLAKAGTTEVICLDKKIIVNPYN